MKLETSNLAWSESLDLFNFGPCPIFGTDETRHFKFGVQINRGEKRSYNGTLIGSHTWLFEWRQYQ